MAKMAERAARTALALMFGAIAVTVAALLLPAAILTELGVRN